MIAVVFVVGALFGFAMGAAVVLLMGIEVRVDDGE